MKRGNIEDLKETKVQEYRIKYVNCPYCKKVIEENRIKNGFLDDFIITCPFCTSNMRVKCE